MTHQITILCGVLGIVVAAAAGPNEAAKSAAPRLVLNEVQPGSMAAEQYCTVVFADRHFHSEKASRNRGKDKERTVYEGVLSEADWNALGGIIDSAGFRELKVPPSVPSLVIEDAHTITISVARDTKFQNMEFVDNKSRKPYESQLKPLLQWWKSFRGHRMVESKTGPDAKCSLDNSHAVFSQ